VFGSLTLVAFNGQRAGDAVTYTYGITNTGSALTDVTLTDIPLGDIAGPFDLASRETRTFQTVAEIHETTTNTGTFSGLLASGAPCSERASATVTLLETCGECDGGVTELTLRYTGDHDDDDEDDDDAEDVGLIRVYEGDKPQPDKLLFEGVVQTDGVFSFTGIRSDGTMSSQISLYVNDEYGDDDDDYDDFEFNTTIHTSCSRPIGPGLIRGDFEVVEGYSKDGGRLCPLSSALTSASADWGGPGRGLLCRTPFGVDARAGETTHEERGGLPQ
jgi:hypothetical protein